MCLCACMIHCRTVGRRVAWKLVHTSHWLWSRHWVSESTESTELGNANWTKFWRSEWNLAKKFSLHKMLWRLKAANCQSFSLAKRGRTFPSIQGTSCHFALTAEPPATQLICDLCRTKRPATKTGLKIKLRQNPSPDLALQSTWIGRLSNLMSLDVTWCHLMSLDVTWCLQIYHDPEKRASPLSVTFWSVGGCLGSTVPSWRMNPWEKDMKIQKQMSQCHNASKIF
jgi:hypothetical protein